MISIIFGDYRFWILIVVLLLISTAYYIYMTWHFGVFKQMGIKGPKPQPFSGNLKDIYKKGMRQCILDNIQAYGKIYGFFYGRNPSLTVCDPDVVRHVLIKEAANFTDTRRDNLNDRKSLFAVSVNNLRGAHWRHVRHCLAPCFSASMLKQIHGHVVICAKQMLDNVQTFHKNDKAFECKEVCGAFAVDTLARTTYGLDLCSHRDLDNPFLRGVKVIAATTLTSARVMLLFVLPFLQRPLSDLFPLYSSQIEGFFTGITKKARYMENKTLVQKMSEKLVSTQVLKKTAVQNDRGMTYSTAGLTEHEVAGNALIFTFAGYDTTSSTLSFAMYSLATHPECQNRLLEEIDRVVGNKTPSYEDLQKLPYLQQVIDETLRLYPPASRLERVARAAITICGYRIPRHMQIGIPVIALHMDPDVWPDPQCFDPDRFTPTLRQSRDPVYHLPFGLGPRHCLGMRLALLQVKIAMVTMLQHYRLVTCDKTEIPLTISTHRVQAANGIWLKVEPMRQNTSESENQN